ncbi:hypothetical protein L1887_57548 [Cichorium endivia]|nr:hypothetical protein L1887_57548 [Cichorium endivia]
MPVSMASVHEMAKRGVRMGCTRALFSSRSRCLEGVEVPLSRADRMLLLLGCLATATLEREMGLSEDATLVDEGLPLVSDGGLLPIRRAHRGRRDVGRLAVRPEAPGEANELLGILDGLRRILLDVVDGRIAVHLALADEGALAALIADLGEDLGGLEMQRGVVACGGGARVDETLYDRLVSLAGISCVFEPALTREGDVLEPVEQLVLLTEADVGHLAGVRVGIDEARAEEAAGREASELVLALTPAVLVEDMLDELLFAAGSFVLRGVEGRRCGGSRGHGGRRHLERGELWSLGETGARGPRDGDRSGGAVIGGIGDGGASSAGRGGGGGLGGGLGGRGCGGCGGSSVGHLTFENVEILQEADHAARADAEQAALDDAQVGCGPGADDGTHKHALGQQMRRRHGRSEVLRGRRRVPIATERRTKIGACDGHGGSKARLRVGGALQLRRGSGRLCREMWSERAACCVVMMVKSLDSSVLSVRVVVERGRAERYRERSVAAAKKSNFSSLFSFFPLGPRGGDADAKKEDRFSQRASESLSSAEPEEPLRCGKVERKGGSKARAKEEEGARRSGDSVEQTWSISSLERCPGSMGSMGTPRTHEIQRGQAIQSELLGEDAPCARAAGVGTAVRGLPKESVQQVGCQMQAKVGELRFYGDVRSFLKQGRAAL